MPLLNHTRHIYAGDTELSRIYVGNEMVWEKYEPIKEISGTPPLQFPSTGENLVDWEITGATDPTTGNKVGIKYQDIFPTYFELGYRQPYTTMGGWRADRFEEKNYYISSHQVVPVEYGKTYTLSFHDDMVEDYYAIQLIKFNENIVSLEEPMPTSGVTPWVGNEYAYFNGKNYASFTISDNRVKYVRLTVGSTRATSANIEYAINHEMLCEGAFNYPYVQERFTDFYALPIVITSGDSTDNFCVGPSATPWGNNDTVSLTSTGLNVKTFEGTNILTIGSEVQPTNVYAKYHNPPPPWW